MKDPEELHSDAHDVLDAMANTIQNSIGELMADALKLGFTDEQAEYFGNIYRMSALNGALTGAMAAMSCIATETFTFAEIVVLLTEMKSIVQDQCGRGDPRMN